MGRHNASRDGQCKIAAGVFPKSCSRDVTAITMTEAEFITAVGERAGLIFDPALPTAERLIPAEWVCRSLTKCDRVTIRNAIIEGNVEVDGIKVTSQVHFADCEFQNLYAPYSEFESLVRFERCRFDAVQMRGARFSFALLFRACEVLQEFQISFSTVGTELDLDKSQFNKDFFAVSCTVGATLFAREAMFFGDVIASNIAVRGQCDLKDSIFRKSLVFVDGSFRTLALPGGVVNGTAKFDRCTVRGTLLCTGRQFHDRTTFMGLRVTGQLGFDDCIFGSEANFEGAEGNDWWFRRAQIQGVLTATGAHFFSADLENTTVVGDAHFLDIKIDTGLSFGGAEFHHAFYLDRARSGAAVRFVASKLRKPKVGGMLSLAGATIGSQLVCESLKCCEVASIESADVRADISIQDCDLRELCGIGVRIGGNLEILETTFNSQCSLSGAVVGQSVIFRGSTFTGQLQLERCQIGQDIVWERTVFRSGVACYALNANGRLAMDSAILIGKLDLRGSRVADIWFQPPAGSKSTAKSLSTLVCDLRHCSYERVQVHCADMIGLLERARPFQRQAYFQYERFLRSIGNDGEADEVYFRQRVQASHQLIGPLDRLSNGLVWSLTGYGVKPLRAVAWLIVLLMTTAFLYHTAKGFADVSQLSANVAPCTSLPNWQDSVGLSIKTYIPVDQPSNWIVANCAIPGLGIKSYLLIDFFRLVVAIAASFLLATVTGLVRYVGRE